MLMFLSTDNISELWEGINTNPPICLQAFVSTGFFKHIYALGCDFKRDPWHLVGYRLQCSLLWESLHWPFSFSVMPFWTRLFISYSLTVHWEFGWYVNGQQAEKSWQIWMLFIYQQSFKYHVSLEMWFSWTIVFVQNRQFDYNHSKRATLLHILMKDCRV